MYDIFVFNLGWIEWKLCNEVHRVIRANARIRHILDVVTVDQLLFTRQLKRNLVTMQI